MATTTKNGKRVGGKREGAGRPLHTERQIKFLAAYAECGNIRQSCRIAGCDRNSVTRDWMSKPEFAAKFALAEAEATDKLEQYARERATIGTPRLKFNPKTGKPYEMPHPDGLMQDDPDGDTVIDEATGEQVPAQVPVMVPYVEYEVSDNVLLRLLEAHNPGKFASRQKIDLKIDSDEAFRNLGESCAAAGLTEEQTAAILKDLAERTRKSVSGIVAPSNAPALAAVAGQ